MTAFDPVHVRTGPGSLYVAPIGTTEPTTLTGAWPDGWVTLGYTDAGSVFSMSTTSEDVTVAEEFFPVDSPITAQAASLTFALAEITARNLLIVLNGGVGDSLVSALTGSTPDGGSWVEPPDPGEEVHLMLGWDSLSKGGSGDATSRLIVRKGLQAGSIAVPNAKAPAKKVYPAEFKVLKSTGVKPFRFLFDSASAA